MLERDREYSWRTEWMGWAIRYQRRPASNLWGRFGGGWQWKVGIDVGGQSVIFNLLVATLRIDPAKTPGPVGRHLAQLRQEWGIE